MKKTEPIVFQYTEFQQRDASKNVSLFLSDYNVLLATKQTNNFVTNYLGEYKNFSVRLKWK